MPNVESFRWQESARGETISRCLFAHFPGQAELPLVARHELYEHGADTGRHWHEDFYALYIIRGGYGLHIINDRPYGITRGDVYILPPGAIHAYQQYHQLTLDALYFQPQLFHSEELHALRSMPGFWQLLISSDDAAPSPGITALKEHALHLPPERYSEAANMISEIFLEFCTASSASRPLTRGLFFRLLVHLARWQAELQRRRTNTPDVSEERSNNRHVVSHQLSIADVIRYCEEHFSDALTVPQLAALMFLSPGRFTELFTQEIGISPAAYLRRLRLERARTLLRTTTLTITRIAHQVGFTDTAQFSRAFHSLFHMSPSTYRAGSTHE